MEKRSTAFNPSWTRTIIFDHGKGFAQHHKPAKDLKLKTYFTRPYTSQDKGTVENRTGVLRRFFPKGTDLGNISNSRVKEVELLINHRPIRKFNYYNPIETLINKTVALMG